MYQQRSLFLNVQFGDFGIKVIEVEHSKKAFEFQGIFKKLEVFHLLGFVFLFFSSFCPFILYHPVIFLYLHKIATF